MNFLHGLLTAQPAAPKLVFEPGNFLRMLPYMGIGMLVIFIIIGAIILTTSLINVIFSKKK